jgi:FkbM family methyltransferase
MTAPPEHHSLVRLYPLAPALDQPGFDVDFLGVRTRRGFDADMGKGPNAPKTPSYPPFDNEYLEWVDVLEAVEEAGDRFVMVDLGAGYGRWSVRAAMALRRRGSGQFTCAAVEAEPVHFRFLRQHLQDNDLRPSDHELIWAAVTAQPGLVPFWIGKASAWYGQAVAERPVTPPPGIRARQRLKARSALGMPPTVSAAEAAVMWVPSITLREVLAGYPRVDLIDMDIQGAELDVVTSAIDLLTQRVRRVHVGTHSASIEEGLRALFGGAGWQNLNDYPCHTHSPTPYGEIAFDDGVQTWLNPLLAPGAPPIPQPPHDGESGLLLKARKQLEQANKRLRDLQSKNARLRKRCQRLEAKLGTIRDPRSPAKHLPWWRGLFRKRGNS